MKTKKRKRGGVSMPCPKCRANSRVAKTRRFNSSLIDDKAVIVTRSRVCLGKTEHFFITEERVR